MATVTCYTIQFDNSAKIKQRFLTSATSKGTKSGNATQMPNSGLFYMS